MCASSVRRPRRSPATMCHSGSICGSTAPGWCCQRRMGDGVWHSTGSCTGSTSPRSPRSTSASPPPEGSTEPGASHHPTSGSTVGERTTGRAGGDHRLLRRRRGTTAGNDREPAWGTTDPLAQPLGGGPGDVLGSIDQGPTDQFTRGIDDQDLPLTLPRATHGQVRISLRLHHLRLRTDIVRPGAQFHAVAPSQYIRGHAYTAAGPPPWQRSTPVHQVYADPTKTSSLVNKAHVVAAAGGRGHRGERRPPQLSGLR